MKTNTLPVPAKWILKALLSVVLCYFFGQMPRWFGLPLEPFTLAKRRRGTRIAICVDCFRGAKSVGSHKLISNNAPNQWDQEVVCVKCGQTMSYYDNGASYGVDFSKTPCQ